MNCQQTRESLEELVDNEGLALLALGVEEHLVSCSECQEWYARELQAIGALELLEPLPVPPDFTAGVMERLPDTLPRRQPSAKAGRESLLRQMQAAWRLLTKDLARPVVRRRLAPALAVVASLLLVLGLWYGLQESDMPITPGTAIGASPWVLGLGGMLVAALLVAALILWRRKE